jgi:hypothetical protein
MNCSSVFTKNKSDIVVLFPTIVMLILPLISYLNILKIGLLIIFPIAFLIQGILCGLIKTNVFIPILVSIITYSILMFLFPDSLTLRHIFLYIKAYVLGYFIIKLMVDKFNILDF